MMSENSLNETQRSGRLDALERLLASRGHDVGVGHLRVAAGRSGIAVGFPRDPMLHVSWPVIVALGLLCAALLSRRSAYR
jgi:hypothetical protein